MSDAPDQVTERRDAQDRHRRTSADPKSPADLARRIVRFRRKREEMLGPMFFADPAWDILLDLLIAEDACRNISVSSLCIAAAVPPTTALRWIRTLTDEGMILRRPHPFDARTVHISLAKETSDRLRELLTEL